MESTDNRKENILKLLSDCNLGWFLCDAERYAERVKGIEDKLESFSQLVKSKNGIELSDPLGEFLKHQDSMKPLVQMLVSPVTVEMLVMAYFVMIGMDVKKVNLEYELEERVNLSVVLEDSGKMKEHKFESNSIWDLEVLGHFGIMKVNEKPILNGFYAYMS